MRYKTLQYVLLATVCLSAPAVDANEPKADDIAGALQPYVDRGTLAGAVVLVADRDKTLSIDAVGFEDVKAKKPMRPDALFWIASQSKPITATAFMMLVDEGKVALDDPISKYIPEFGDLWVLVEKDSEKKLLRKSKSIPTIRQILSHTSGMPFASDMEKPTLDGLTLEQCVRSYAMTPLQSDPGTKYSYSNAGINTAGRIIEIVSGMPYEKFLEDRLFRPLGMKDTTFRLTSSQVARLAKSYKPGEGNKGLEETTIGQLHYPLDAPERQPMPAGGLFSTAEDVGKFCRMVLNGGELDGHRYLSKKSVEQMTTKQTPAGVPDQYGLGWSTGGGNFGHGGAFSTDMTIDPRLGRIAVYLVQHAGFPGDGGESKGAFMKRAFAH